MDDLLSRFCKNALEKISKLLKQFLFFDSPLFFATINCGAITNPHFFQSNVLNVADKSVCTIVSKPRFIVVGKSRTGFSR